MSYFKVELGKRLVEAKQQVEKPADATADSLPFFSAVVGGHPSEASQQIGPQAGSAHPIALSPCHPVGECPLCRGALELADGLYRCAGRCGARWLEEAPGRLIDLAALPFGICRCCRPPRPLGRGRDGLLCPTSGRAHIVLPGGEPVLSDTLPHGTCLCCDPAMPLIRQGDLLACLARPDRRYRRVGDRLALISQPAPAAATADAIDAALRRNAARLTINGLFDLD